MDTFYFHTCLKSTLIFACNSAFPSYHCRALNVLLLEVIRPSTTRFFQGLNSPIHVFYRPTFFRKHWIWPLDSTMYGTFTFNKSGSLDSYVTNVVWLSLALTTTSRKILPWLHILWQLVTWKYNFVPPLPQRGLKHILRLLANTILWLPQKVHLPRREGVNPSAKIQSHTSFFAKPVILSEGSHYENNISAGIVTYFHTDWGGDLVSLSLINESLRVWISTTTPDMNIKYYFTYAQFLYCVLNV